MDRTAGGGREAEAEAAPRRRTAVPGDTRGNPESSAADGAHRPKSEADRTDSWDVRAAITARAGGHGGRPESCATGGPETRSRNSKQSGIFLPTTGSKSSLRSFNATSGEMWKSHKGKKQTNPPRCLPYSRRLNFFPSPFPFHALRLFSPLPTAGLILASPNALNPGHRGQGPPRAAGARKAYFRPGGMGEGAARRPAVWKAPHRSTGPRARPERATGDTVRERADRKSVV